MPAPVLKARSSDVAEGSKKRYRSDVEDTDVAGGLFKKKHRSQSVDSEQRLRWSRKTENEQIQACNEARNCLQRLIKLGDQVVGGKKKPKWHKDSYSVSSDDANETKQGRSYRATNLPSEVAEDAEKTDTVDDTAKTTTCDVAEVKTATFDVAEVKKTMRKVGNRIFGTYNWAAIGGLITLCGRGREIIIN